MDYLQFIASNQKEESISIQRVNKLRNLVSYLFPYCPKHEYIIIGPDKHEFVGVNF